MNILVVDDEYYIVKNIIETTDWSALGIEQAFPAYSASQAKRIFEGSQDIDILLTDIEMPRETGLQLVEFTYFLLPVKTNRPGSAYGKAGGGCAGGEKKCMV